MSEADSNTTPTVSTVQDVVGDGGDAALAPVVAVAPSADPTPSPAVVVPVHEAADAAIVLEPHVFLAPATRVRYYTAPQCTVLSPLTTILFALKRRHRAGMTQYMAPLSPCELVPSMQLCHHRQHRRSSSDRRHQALQQQHQSTLYSVPHNTQLALCCAVASLSMHGSLRCKSVKQRSVATNTVAAPTHQSATHSSRSSQTRLLSMTYSHTQWLHHQRHPHPHRQQQRVLPAMHPQTAAHQSRLQLHALLPTSPAATRSETTSCAMVWCGLTRLTAIAVVMQPPLAPRPPPPAPAPPVAPAAVPHTRRRYQLEHEGRQQQRPLQTQHTRVAQHPWKSLVLRWLHWCWSPTKAWRSSTLPQHQEHLALCAIWPSPPAPTGICPNRDSCFWPRAGAERI